MNFENIRPAQGRGFLKLRKFIQRPGEFWRDFFLKRYPVFEIQSGSAKANKNSGNNFSEFLHHNSDPYKVQFPIDVVITWVDGSDPVWRAKKAKYVQVAENSITNNESRFKSRDELRYCIRSIYTYIPWVRNIFLVTDNQKPDWLIETGRLKVIDHTQIIPKKFLPTFNSHVIESWFHKIPGLSEHFLYFNDDVMVTRPTPPEHYFSSGGLSHLFITKAETPDGPVDIFDTPTQAAAKNVRTVLMDKFGQYMRYNFAHSVHCHRKSAFELIHKEWPKLIATYCRNRTRGVSDFPMASYWANNVALLTGAADVRRTSCFYFDIRSDMAATHYRTLLRRKGKADAPFSICLNDVAPNGDGDEAKEMAMQEFLEAYFPTPSPCELNQD